MRVVGNGESKKSPKNSPSAEKLVSWAPSHNFVGYMFAIKDVAIIGKKLVKQ